MMIVDALTDAWSLRDVLKFISSAFFFYTRSEFFRPECDLYPTRLGKYVLLTAKVWNLPTYTQSKRPYIIQ